MMNAIMKKHLKKKKGFTLIEVVVVLVILAILAAIAIPALTGYITDAQNRAADTEAKSVYTALQHMATTAETDKKIGSATDAWFTGTASQLTGLGPAAYDRIKELTGMTIAANSISDLYIDGTTVKGFKYTASNGKIVTYGTLATTP